MPFKFGAFARSVLLSFFHNFRLFFVKLSLVRLYLQTSVAFFRHLLRNEWRETFFCRCCGVCWWFHDRRDLLFISNLLIFETICVVRDLFSFFLHYLLVTVSLIVIASIFVFVADLFSCWPSIYVVLSNFVFFAFFYHICQIFFYAGCLLSLFIYLFTVNSASSTIVNCILRVFDHCLLCRTVNFLFLFTFLLFFTLFKV